MFSALKPYLHKPTLFAPGSAPFWDGDHISQGMLDAHLNVDLDAATRPLDFVRRSVAWIAEVAPPAHYPALLDLGCGPGIYAEHFAAAGYTVTGIDLSRRSIAYARTQADRSGSAITYHNQSYLELDAVAAFDVVTLIYCDFGVLSREDRDRLLLKIHAALRPGGKFIVDFFTPLEHAGRAESRTWEHHAAGGFWSAAPHLCIHAYYRYDEDDTVLTQAIVVEEQSVQCYNIWEHCFTRASAAEEFAEAGFGEVTFFGDVAGSPGAEGDKVTCAVVSK